MPFVRTKCDNVPGGFNVKCFVAEVYIISAQLSVNVSFCLSTVLCLFNAQTCLSVESLTGKESSISLQIKRYWDNF